MAIFQADALNDIASNLRRLLEWYQLQTFMTPKQIKTDRQISQQELSIS